MLMLRDNTMHPSNRPIESLQFERAELLAINTTMPITKRASADNTPGVHLSAMIHEHDSQSIDQHPLNSASRHISGQVRMAGGGSAESDGLASYYATRSKEPSTLVDALLLGDILRLVWHGSRRELKDDDIPPPLKPFRSFNHDALDDEAHALWEAELAREARTGGKRRKAAMLRALLAPHNHLVAIGLLISAVQGFLQTFGRFVVLDMCIRAVIDGAPTQRKVALVCAFSLLVLLEGLLDAVSRQIIAGPVFHRLIACASALMMRKTSALSTDTAQGAEVTALYSGDAPRVLSYSRWLARVPAALCSLVGGIVVLIMYLGSSALVGVASLVIFIITSAVISGAAAKIGAYFFRRQMHA